MFGRMTIFLSGDVLTQDHLVYAKSVILECDSLSENAFWVVHRGDKRSTGSIPISVLCVSSTDLRVKLKISC